MKIALLLDGSDGDAVAVDRLTGLPFEAGSEVVLVDARPPETAAEDIVPRLEERGWTVTQRAVEPTWDAIGEQLEPLGADLVVASAGDSDEPSRLGTPPKGVVRAVESAFLICRARPSDGESGDERPLKLLVAYDDSAPARAAIRSLRELSWPKGTQITLLSVLTVGTTMFRRDILERLGDDWQQHRREVIAELETVASSLADAAEVSTRVLDGGTDPSDEIVQAARLLDADWIVAGYNGRSVLREALLGSVTGQLIDYAPCSVWIIRN